MYCIQARISRNIVIRFRTRCWVVTGNGSHDVNSIHHQAIDTLGRGLMVSATSPDGVIEAVEWALKDRMPFLLGVQWHPERMKDVDNPHARAIAEYFLREVHNYR